MYSHEAVGKYTQMNGLMNIQKYSYLLALSKVKDEYESRGYEVKVDYPISSGIMADLYASKDNDKVLIELKSKIPSESMRNRMSKFAQSEGMRYVFLHYTCNLTISEIELNRL